MPKLSLESSGMYCHVVKAEDSKLLTRHHENLKSHMPKMVELIMKKKLVFWKQVQQYMFYSDTL
jgi:hypothetical protein